MSEKVAILVVGMHRSGTSALAKTISILGARLPADLVAPNEGNPKGHWEPQGVVDLNDKMLADAGSDVYGACDFSSAWFSSPRVNQFIGTAAEILRTSYENDPFIVVKDPRIALVLPIWHAAFTMLGYRCVHLLPLRCPREVAESLRRRHLKNFPYDAWTRPRGEVVWLRYTLASVLKTRNTSRCFVRYSELLADWRGVVRNIIEQTGVTFPLLGSSVEGEIDRFLHSNDVSDSSETVKGAAPSDLAAITLAELADVLYAALQQHGDKKKVVDTIDQDFSRRMQGSYDLVGMLEGLYPLVWKYHDAAQNALKSSGQARQTEAGLHQAVQQLWSDLSRTTSDKGTVQQDLGSCQERVRTLETALDQVSASLAASQMRCAELDHQASEFVRVLEEHRTALSAMQSSTSWRITRPMRAIVQRLKA